MEVLPTIEAESVHTCVTSPPYFGLRIYDIPPTAWPAVEYSPMAGLPPVEIPEWEGHLGLEDDPYAYIGHLVEVFRRVRRVLRDDGTLWCNLGDRYASGGCGGGGKHRVAWDDQPELSRWRPPPSGLKHKDLIGIPWRLALALQADGWYWRSPCALWHKPNCRPENVADRPTLDYEPVLMFAKSRHYYFDMDAVREPHKTVSLMPPQTWSGTARDYPDVDGHPGGRAMRTIWSIATGKGQGGHSSVFPEELPVRPIKAGTSEHGCCSVCGAPYRRIVEITYEESPEHGPGSQVGRRGGDGRRDTGLPRKRKVANTLGWDPTCDCDADDPVPCTVLDPFSGTGTTGLVAHRLGRSYVGIDADANNNQTAAERIRQDAPLLTQDIREEAI